MPATHDFDEVSLDAVGSRNVFLLLGRYVERQEENLLTQSLTLLFNRVAPFRRLFLKQLSDRHKNATIDPDRLVARAQRRRRIRGGHVIVDMEISLAGLTWPLFLVESKLAASLGSSQIRNYHSALQRLPRSSRLVILTRHAVDADLWKYTPPKTIWLSWPMVAELAALSLPRAAPVDQFLLKEFLEMAKLKGISTIPPMALDSFRRLSRFSSFAADKAGQTRLNPKTVSAIALAMQRLAEHRDSAWERVFAKSSNWRPYLSIYMYGNRAVIQAGFWRRRPRKDVQQSYLGLELVCSERPRLYWVRGLHFSPKHPQYERGDAYDHDAHPFSASYTQRLFMMPMPRATAFIEMEMLKASQLFFQSRYSGKQRR